MKKHAPSFHDDYCRVAIIVSDDEPSQTLACSFPRNGALSHSDLVVDRLIVRQQSFVGVSLPEFGLSADAATCNATDVSVYETFGYLMDALDRRPFLDLMSALVLRSAYLHALDNLTPVADALEKQAVSTAKERMKQRIGDILADNIEHPNPDSDKENRAKLLDSVIADTHAQISESMDSLSKDRVVRKRWLAAEKHFLKRETEARAERFTQLCQKVGLSASSIFGVLFASHVFGAPRVRSFCVGYLACFYDDFDQSPVWTACGPWIQTDRQLFESLCPWRNDDYEQLLETLRERWQTYRMTGSLPTESASDQLAAKMATAQQGDETSSQLASSNPVVDEQEEEQVSEEEIYAELQRLQGIRATTRQKTPVACGESVIARELQRRKPRTPQIAVPERVKTPIPSPVVTPATSKSTPNVPSRYMQVFSQQSATRKPVTPSSATKKRRDASSEKPQKLATENSKSEQKPKGSAGTPAVAGAEVVDVESLENDIDNLMSILTKQLSELSARPPLMSKPVASPAAPSNEILSTFEQLAPAQSSTHTSRSKVEENDDPTDLRLTADLNIHGSLSLSRFLQSSRVRRVFRKRSQLVIQSSSPTDIQHLCLPNIPKHFVPNLPADYIREPYEMLLAQEAHVKHAMLDAKEKNSSDVADPTVAASVHPAIVFHSVDNGDVLANDVREELLMLERSQPSSIFKTISYFAHAVCCVRNERHVDDLLAVVKETTEGCSILSPLLQFSGIFLRCIRQWMTRQCTVRDIICGIELANMSPLFRIHGWVPIALEWVRLQEMRVAVQRTLVTASDIFKVNDAELMYRRSDDEYIDGEFAEWIAAMSFLFTFEEQCAVDNRVLSSGQLENTLASIPACLHESDIVWRLRARVDAENAAPFDASVQFVYRPSDGSAAPSRLSGGSRKRSPAKKSPTKARSFTEAEREEGHSNPVDVDN